jgi:DNA-binding GntR family transcriptional regulator
MPPESSSSPRYARIAQVLRARLEAHDASHDRPFATEQALCEEFGVSRTTVRNALGFLKREGLVTSRRGVGTNGTSAEKPHRVVRSSGDPLHGMLKSKPRVVTVGRVAAPAPVAKFFGVETGAPVFGLTRVHDLHGEPLSVVKSYLPAHLEVGVPRSAWRQPMHDLLWERFGLRIARSVHTLRVGRAMADIAGLLGVGLADPVLRIQASTYLADRKPIRWTENFFREDRYEYVAEMEWPAPRTHPSPMTPRSHRKEQA